MGDDDAPRIRETHCNALPRRGDVEHLLYRVLKGQSPESDSRDSYVGRNLVHSLTPLPRLRKILADFWGREFPRREQLRVRGVGDPPAYLAPDSAARLGTLGRMTSNSRTRARRPDRVEAVRGNHRRSSPFASAGRGLALEGLFVAIPVLLVLAVVSPVLAAIALATVIAVGFSQPQRAVAAVAIVSVTGVFAWMNATKQIFGDWIWYTDHFGYLVNLSLSEYMAGNYAGIQPKETEPIYYAISKALAVASDGNVSVLAIAVTILVYVPLGWAIAKFVMNQTASTELTGFAVAIAMIVGPTFTLSTQLVRQTIAASFIAAALIAFGMHRSRIGILLIMFAVLTHNAALVPALAILIAAILARASAVRAWWIVGIGAMFVVLGLAYIRLQGAGEYRGASDGSVSYAVIFFDAVLAIIFAVVVLRSATVAYSARLTVLVLPALFGFVLGVISQPLPLLRMYFFIEVVRALIIAFLIVKVFAARTMRPLLLGVLVLAVVYCEARIGRAPWGYGGGLIEHLLRGPLA